MHLSTVGQLAHPAEDVDRRAGRHRDRIATNGHELPGENSQTMEGYDRTRVGWREGETLGYRSDLCKGIRRGAAMNSLWCHFICS